MKTFKKIIRFKDFSLVFDGCSDDCLFYGRVDHDIYPYETHFCECYCPGDPEHPDLELSEKGIPITPKWCQLEEVCSEYVKDIEEARKQKKIREKRLDELMKNDPLTKAIRSQTTEDVIQSLEELGIMKDGKITEEFKSKFKNPYISKKPKRVVTRINTVEE